MLESKPKNTIEPRKSLERSHILGKITIMRHGATEYTNQFPDLSQKGIEQARERGKYLKANIDPETEDVLFATSPSARAQGTMSIILEELGQKDAEVRVLKTVRSTEKRNADKAQAMIEEIDWRNDMAAWDRFYATYERFEKSPDVWQPRSEIEARFYKGLEYAIRSFIKYQKNQQEGKIPHLVTVSHFEFLNHFVVKVFNLDLQKDKLFSFTEAVEMEIEQIDPKKPNQIIIKMSFRGQNKNIVFNRENRSIEIMQ